MEKIFDPNLKILVLDTTARTASRCRVIRVKW